MCKTLFLIIFLGFTDLYSFLNGWVSIKIALQKIVSIYTSNLILWDLGPIFLSGIHLVTFLLKKYCRNSFYQRRSLLHTTNAFNWVWRNSFQWKHNICLLYTTGCYHAINRSKAMRSSLKMLDYTKHIYQHTSWEKE